MKRVVIGKGIGFLIGLLAFVILPSVLPDASMMLRVGIVFWYTMMGAFIAVFGVIDYHPILKMRMNAWFRGIFIGGSMNLVLVLVAYDALVPLMATAVFFTGMSPFWLIAEGVVAGVVIDVLATKKTGEGSSLCQS